MIIDLESQLIKDAKIMIVDETMGKNGPMEKLLAQNGYAKSRCVTDPREALAQFLEFQPDLLLLDWHMSSRSGEEVLSEIKERVSEGEMPPVLVLTGDSSPAVRQRALAIGANDFLTKPLDFIMVLLRIQNLLRWRVLNLYVQTENTRLEEKIGVRTVQLQQSLAELKGVQQQIVEQERLRALGAMAGGVAHDFNNALTVIMGFSEIFTSETEINQESVKALECFQTINRAAGDGAEIVRRLRAFYRPYNEKEDGRQTVDMNAIVSETVLLTTPKWQTKSRAGGIAIELKSELAADVPGILAAASEMREMVINLIFNAVDAMPQGGCITIRTGMEGGNILLEVEDSGTGMTDETRSRCLEPFFTTKGDKGTGLGLAIIYGIINRHNGSIRIKTELNHGTRFTILLPCTKAELRAASEPMPPPGVIPEPVAQRPLRVLLVDDQADIRSVLIEFLEQLAHTVVTAENGVEALEKYRKERFDLVITDQAMPKMNGEQVAAAIREINPVQPVILLTAFEEEIKEQSKNVDLLMSKPVSMQLLREAINKVIDAEEGLSPSVSAMA